MSAFFKKRAADFSKIFNGSSLISQSELTAEFVPTDGLLNQLEASVFAYLKASCPEVEYSGDVSDLQSYLQEFQLRAANISTSGMVIPKNICEAEFTEIHRCLSMVLEKAGVLPFVEKWIFPFNVRLKSFQSAAVNTGYPTEFPHTETWVGCSARSVLFHIPLFGDLEKNSLQVWRPRDDSFDITQMRPLKSYLEADEVVKTSSLVSLNTKRRSLFLVDSALLHNTFRSADAGLRVSIDFNAIFNVYPLDQYPDDYSLVVDRQLIGTDQLRSLGVTHRILAPDGIYDRYSPQDGMRHPAHVRIIS